MDDHDDDDHGEDDEPAERLAPRLRPYVEAFEAARRARTAAATPEEIDQAAAIAWEVAHEGLTPGEDG